MIGTMMAMSQLYDDIDDKIIPSPALHLTETEQSAAHIPQYLAALLSPRL